ncbi:MAG: D-cysteine desulfhydrase [Rhodospirillales bacterium]|nr:D-cysteine desulfhydrase [Rhodospirillales bacterium]
MQLARFARERFAHLPTPLEPLTRLSEALGGPRLFIKRDDSTGLALGGNKTRKLEFLIAEAKDQGADTIISAGGVQSNHVRQTAAAAARSGLACDLVLTRIVPWNDADYEKTGNVQLDELLGARIHIHPAATDRDAAMISLADQVHRRGGRPYIIPVGGSNATGALGYVNCAMELERQANDMGVVIDSVVHAASSGGTQAGLIAGFHAIGSRTRVIGIDVDANPSETAATVWRVLTATCKKLGLTRPETDGVVVVEGGYAGDSYGLPTAAMVEAVTRLARTEGLVLDPVYTGKAMAGLIDLIAQGRFSGSDTVVFLHTGGTPALFAYGSAFAGS